MSVVTEEQLQRARARLIALEDERAEVRAVIAGLERASGAAQTATAEDRVRLFASLFRGRPDVFAKRWESRTRPGRAGWAPACDNEWKPGICEKPRVKCAACTQRRFVACSDAQVRRHLEGRQTIGIYPLLRDETCWLVAIDLDGPTWKEDAGALREAATEADVPVLVERSRSGEGAHVWVLFDRPVAARLARAIASWLLTQAMSRRAISLGSYDRVFPNQDTMPSGGFGNLIALPLQRERRAEGCTVFLDGGLEPHPDQWAYLAGAARLAGDRAQLLAAEAERTGTTLPVGQWADGATVTPARRLTRVTAPATVTGTLRGRLELNVAGLSAQLVDRLRRTAAFANPVFYERERARLTTHNTPRVIACHELTGDRLLLPRGCVEGARRELDEAGVTLELHDARGDGATIDARFVGALSDAQQRAVEVLAGHEIGVLVAPPGSGKTVMAASLIARRGRSTLILVHRRPLLEQWVKRLAQFLGLAVADIGVLGTRDGAAGIDVAMIQGLARRDDVAELLGGYGHVVVDECHHVSAVSVERLLREIACRHVTGLTATPRRRDGHHPIIAMQCGPVRHTLTATSEEAGGARRVVLERRTVFDPATLPTDPGIQEVLTAIAADADRTRRISDDVLAELAAGRFPLVLTERRAHLDALAALLRDRAPGLVTLHGGMGVRQRRLAAELLACEQPRIVLATGRYIGEGFDDPRLDTLVLAMPIAWSGTMTQYAGRLQRHHAAKREIRILDYVDHEVPVLRRMYAKRLKAYAALGYQRA